LSTPTIRAGQELTNLKLHPGEEIRTPLIALQFWRGDRTRSQNVWRRWMVAHNIPRVNGKPIPPHYASCWGADMQPTAAEEIEQVKGYERERIKLDYWILDAGWYPGMGAWVNVGTWEPDPVRFPSGLRELSDAVHATGAKFVVWFEPERVTPATWLYQNHPEWLLAAGDDSGNTPQLGKASAKLFNLGSPEARQWLTDYVVSFTQKQGIDYYRQDFNIDPLAYWRENDPPDRQGITENAYVCGYLAYWDDLRRRVPGLLIDSCASGGRRNDLETMRRSVPLLRSDFFTTAESQQAQTIGLSPWLPYYGSGTGASDAYMIRSSFCPAYRIAWDTRKTDLDYDFLRRMVDQFRRISPYLMGDFYPLTPYTIADDAWAAWQFDSPSHHAGVVQVFRRAKCIGDSHTIVLHGLDARARYTVTDLDTATTRTLTGSQLMTEGIRATVGASPGSALFLYMLARSTK